MFYHLVVEEELFTGLSVQVYMSTDQRTTPHTVMVQYGNMILLICVIGTAGLWGIFLLCQLVPPPFDRGVIL